MRVEDIEGAQPKLTKSITESRRIKLKSSDLRDVLEDIRNYRQRNYDKNGYVQLHNKIKPDSESAKQHFNIFEEVSKDEQLAKDQDINNRRKENSSLDMFKYYVSSKNANRSNPRQHPLDQVSYSVLDNRKLDYSPAIPKNKDISPVMLRSHRKERLDNFMIEISRQRQHLLQMKNKILD